MHALLSESNILTLPPPIVASSENILFDQIENEICMNTSTNTPNTTPTMTPTMTPNKKLTLSHIKPLPNTNINLENKIKEESEINKLKNVIRMMYEYLDSDHKEKFKKNIEEI